jgi:hypothetical protein
MVDWIEPGSPLLSLMAFAKNIGYCERWWAIGEAQSASREETP